MCIFLPTYFFLYSKRQMKIYKHLQEDINKENKIEVRIKSNNICIHMKSKIKHKKGLLTYNKGNK